MYYSEIVSSHTDIVCNLDAQLLSVQTVAWHWPQHFTVLALDIL